MAHLQVAHQSDTRVGPSMDVKGGVGSYASTATWMDGGPFFQQDQQEKSSSSFPPILKNGYSEYP